MRLIVSESLDSAAVHAVEVLRDASSCTRLTPRQGEAVDTPGAYREHMSFQIVSAHLKNNFLC